MEIKIVNKSDNPLPGYQTIYSAGMDLHAYLKEEIVLKPGERKLIPTGLFLELPVGYEAQIRPRSGLAIHHGITVLNAPGTIDSDYRGEVMVILINHSDKPFTFKNGDRIAQMIIAEFSRITWNHVPVLNETERKSGGFGSTGR